MSPWHWALVIAVGILLFGAKRLPDAARSLGRSTRILKAELRDDAPSPVPGATTSDTATPPGPSSGTVADSRDGAPLTTTHPAPPGPAALRERAGNR